MLRRGCLLALCLVLLLVVGAAGWFYYRWTSPSSIVAGLPTVAPSKEAAAVLDSKLQDYWESLKAASISETGSSATAAPLEITEAEATSKLAEVVEKGQLPVEIDNPQVHFRDDRVKASAEVTVGGVVVPVAVQAQVEAEEGKPKVTLEKIDVGGLSAPESVREQVRSAINSGVSSANLDKLPVKIDGITITDGTLSILASQANK